MSEHDDASAYRCVICDRDLTQPAHVCRRCRDIIGKALDAIVELHAQLDPARPAGAPGERVTGSAEPPIPIRPDAVDLAAPARVPEPSAIARQWPQDQQGHLSVATVLDQWVRDWREIRDRGERLPAPTVPVLAGWLRVRVDWAADEHPAVDEFAAEIRDLETVLRAVTGVDRDQTSPIGPCPDCGTGLRATPWQTSVECRPCGTRWDRGSWGDLARQMREAA